jgi:hypothetical protein
MASRFPEQRFPVALMRKHEALIRKSTLLTMDQWGDYVIFRHWRNRRSSSTSSDFYDQRSAKSTRISTASGTGTSCWSVMGSTPRFRQMTAGRIASTAAGS